MSIEVGLARSVLVGGAVGWYVCCRWITLWLLKLIDPTSDEWEGLSWLIAVASSLIFAIAALMIWTVVEWTVEGYLQ